MKFIKNDILYYGKGCSQIVEDLDTDGTPIETMCTHSKNEGGKCCGFSCPNNFSNAHFGIGFCCEELRRLALLNARVYKFSDYPDECLNISVEATGSSFDDKSLEIKIRYEENNFTEFFSGEYCMFCGSKLKQEEEI